MNLEKMKRILEAQKKTEEEIRVLTRGQKHIREELGGLSRSVAYALETKTKKTENIIRLLVGHFATNAFLKEAKERGQL